MPEQMAEITQPRHLTEPESGQKALIDAFDRYGTEEGVKAGTIIIRQGEIGRDGYFLRAGRLAVFASTPFGEVQLAKLEAPALVGEIAALAGLSRTANVRTLEDSIIVKLPGEMLLQAALSQSEIFLPVVRKLGAELEKLNNAIGLYTDALNALERQDNVTEVTALLANPPAQMAGFAEAFGRFARQIAEKKRQQDELASAALIQQSFLPKAEEMSALSTLVTMHAHMSAARHVGGDFYDALRLDDSRILVVIGDVCGKGIPASLFMAVVITTLRSVLRPGCDAADIASAVNSLVCKSNPSAMFATAIIAILDTKSGTLQYCNCGHCPLMLIKADGTILSFGKTGIPIGKIGRAHV